MAARQTRQSPFRLVKSGEVHSCCGISQVIPDYPRIILDMTVFRVGDGTVPLAIVIYIDGSFVKHSIPVKPIYITLRNLDSVVSGKAMAWRVLGMLPSFKKSATPNETDDWRRQRSLGMHHACIKHFRCIVTVFTQDILVYQQVLS